MSAIVEAVGDVFEAVGDAVGSVVEGIGNIVEKVVDEVVEPVVKAVGNTIEAAMDDPLGTLVKVGTAVFAPALLPAVNLGLAVANGVPLEKALINTGLNMIGAQVGNFVGGQLTCTFDLGCFASDVVTAGAKGFVTSGLKGDCVLEGTAGAMLNNVMNTGAKNLASGKGLFGCAATSTSGTTQYDPDSLTTSGLPQGCQGSALNTGLGAMPSCASSGSLGTVTVSAPRGGFCTDLTCISGSLGTTGSAATTDAGAMTGTGALDTVTVTAQRPTCTDITCTFSPSTTDSCKGTMVVTGQRPRDTDVTCTFDPTTTLSPDETTDMGTVVVTGQRPTCTDITCVTELPEVVVTGKRPECELGMCCKFTGFKPPELKLPKINIPKSRQVQTVGTAGAFGCGAIPWLDTRDSLLRNQIVFDRPTDETIKQAKINDMYGRMDGCLAKEMQDRFGGVPQIKLKPFDEPVGGLPQGPGFATGGNVEGTVTYCYNQDAKYMPKFVNCGPDFLTNSAASKRVPLTHKELKHLQARISQHGNMGGLASGGLPKKYQEAMPKDHNPEFVTGMTGYYACGGGTGQSDDIPAMLHDGDYVMDADVVAALGDGSSKAGRAVLDGFRSQIRHSETAKGKPVPAKIADGEYVFPAGFVSALGGGDNKAGAKILDGLREKLRAHKRSAPTSKIPPKAKSPLDYIKQAKG
jgi:hypothetical protein